MECRQCGSAIEQKSGRGRPKIYCSSNCRVAYHRDQKRYCKTTNSVTKIVYHKIGQLYLKPITLKEANAFVDQYHAHHQPVIGHKFSIGVVRNGFLVGVVIVGRPVSRELDDGFTAEVTRCCTNRVKNAASMLMSVAWRAAKSMGYMRIISYTLEYESGSSLQAAGYIKTEKIRGKTWDTPSRSRTDKHPTCDKWRWEISRAS
jgi:hypothetical protein